MRKVLLRMKKQEKFKIINQNVVLKQIDILLFVITVQVIQYALKENTNLQGIQPLKMMRLIIAQKNVVDMGEHINNVYRKKLICHHQNITH